MKQKVKDITPVTKEALKEVLQDYPTKNDFDKFDKKTEKRLTASFEAFRQENNHNFQMMREDLRTEMSKFTNLILTAIDPLIKDLETRREDREIAAAEMKDVKQRLTKLEQS